MERQLMQGNSVVNVRVTEIVRFWSYEDSDSYLTEDGEINKDECKDVTNKVYNKILESIDEYMCICDENDDPFDYKDCEEYVFNSDNINIESHDTFNDYNIEIEVID